MVLKSLRLILPRNGRSAVQSLRLMSSCPVTKDASSAPIPPPPPSPTSKEENPLGWADAKPLNSVPTITFFNILYQTFRGDPNLRNDKKKMHKYFQEKFDEFDSNILRITVPGVPTTILFKDPEEAKLLINANEKNPVEPGFDFFVTYRQNLRKDMYEVPGLIGSHGEQWHDFRTKVQQDMMRPKSAFFYIDEIAEVSEAFLDLIQSQMQGGVIKDMTPLLYRWALEATGTIFLNTRIGCLDEPPSAKAKLMIESVNETLGDPIMELTAGLPLWKLYRTTYLKRFDEASENLYRTSDKLIKDAIKKFGLAPEKSKTDMSVLEKLIDKCGKESAIPTVMAMDALMAGIDTTGNTTAFLTYHLASNPDKQEILYQEIMEKLGPNGAVTPAILNEMKYLKAVQHESQRLLPATTGVGRRIEQDMVLAGYRIPKGSNVSYFGYLAATSEEHFNDPTQFRPERFLRGHKDQHSAHPFAFIPFGHGSRMCIGRRFAELEVQIMAIQTLRRFKLEYAGDVPVDFITPFINRPDGPISIKFTPRN